MTSKNFTDLQIRFISAVVLLSAQLAVFYLGYKAIIVELHLLTVLGTYEITRCSFSKFRDMTVKDKKISGSLLLRIFPYVFVFSAQFSVSGKWLLSMFFGYYIDTSIHQLIGFLLIMFSLSLFIVSIDLSTLSTGLNVLAHTVVTSCIIAPVVYCYSKIAELSLGLLLLGFVAIILNDTMAYVFGRLFGKHKLISLSPKKTIEGFVGALISVPLIMIFIPLLFERCPSLYCPRSQPFHKFVTCKKPSYFRIKKYDIFGLKVKMLKIQFHSFIIGIYASTFGPVMGFLASGFKRFHGIKDFSNLIPGHGGVVDRVDCQTSMAIFLYLYYKAFIN